METGDLPWLIPDDASREGAQRLYDAQRVYFGFLPQECRDNPRQTVAFCPILGIISKPPKVYLQICSQTLERHLLPTFPTIQIPQTNLGMCCGTWRDQPTGTEELDWVQRLTWVLQQTAFPILTISWTALPPHGIPNSPPRRDLPYDFRVRRTLPTDRLLEHLISPDGPLRWHHTVQYTSNVFTIEATDEDQGASPRAGFQQLYFEHTVHPWERFRDAHRPVLHGRQTGGFGNAHNLH